MPTKYQTLLTDARWATRRREILARDGHTCTTPRCGAITNLQVHHKRYIRARNPWDYPDHLLITLCAECHRRHTRLYRRRFMRLRQYKRRGARLLRRVGE